MKTGNMTSDNCEQVLVLVALLVVVLLMVVVLPALLVVLVVKFFLFVFLPYTEKSEKFTRI